MEQNEERNLFLQNVHWIPTHKLHIRTLNFRNLVEKNLSNSAGIMQTHVFNEYTTA